mmetsp:Transcript_40408/g.65122  ORF Transcript_40408/g.65122 Transcript_40408/m.65122 type:complete len:92 (+) Transcript_40408:2359-2634(+)
MPREQTNDRKATGASWRCHLCSHAKNYTTPHPTSYFPSSSMTGISNRKHEHLRTKQLTLAKRLMVPGHHSSLLAAKNAKPHTIKYSVFLHP